MKCSSTVPGAVGLGVLLSAVNLWGFQPPSPSLPTTPKIVPVEKGRSAAFDWLDIALEATAREHERNGPRPTIGSRMLGMVVTAQFDAWAAYDEKAVGTRLGAILRRPPAERTGFNKAKAQAVAAYRSLLFLFPEDQSWLEAQAVSRGLEPADLNENPANPVGVGNIVARALIDYRTRDGSNQTGKEVGSSGNPYSDWTFYRSVNTPEKVNDPDRWQIIPFDDGKGGKVFVDFLTPHWYRVTPFGLNRADQFRPGPPPAWNSEQMRKEIEEVITYNASLNPKDKAIVEFMRDGPRSTGQSGHWLRFAQEVSRRDRHNLDQDIKLFFAVGNVAMDAFIAAWDTKRFYDSSRPWTLIRVLYKGQNIKGWGGPGKGVIEIPADKWHPYSPTTFVTPPFPGYVSGHSTVSGACARMLELFTGSDRFGVAESRLAGELTEPGVDCKTMQAFQGSPSSDPNLTCQVRLGLPTFSATAEMAGISRVMGGYHIQADNIEGLKLGRKVADWDWAVIQAHFQGNAKIR